MAAPAERPDLRPMTKTDMPRGVALLAQLGYEMSEAELAGRVAEVLAMPDHLLLVAEAAGAVVGLLHAFARPAVENPRETVVQAIVVDAAFRRTGVGRVLMAAAESWGAARRCRSVVLSSNATRAPAHTFYAALGYRVSATSQIFRKPL